MAIGSTYRVPFRRRREGKTDYRRRLKLLYNRKPRVVVRKSNKLIRMQLVLFDQVGDKTVVSSMSSELKKFGYDGGTSNIPAAYLTGLLLGKKAKEAGFDEAILDTGLKTPIHASKEYAALKGVVNSGMSIPHDPAVFPGDERIKGEHIANFKHDSSIVDNFEAVKKGILAES